MSLAMKRSAVMLAALAARGGVPRMSRVPLAPLVTRAASLAPSSRRHLSHVTRQSSLINNNKVNTMAYSTGTNTDFIFRQLFDSISSTYTYILADSKSNEAIIIDPVFEKAQRDVQVIRDLDLNLIYAINTHVHADHVTGTGEIKTLIPTCKSVIAKVSKAVADIQIAHGEKIKFGQHELECRSTPGHTDGCFTYVWHDKGMAFTGDALLIRGCGRTDFQQGDSATLFDSVHSQIFSLPQSTLLYPAHDYTGRMVTSVAEEVKHNQRLNKTKEHFLKVMEELKLDYPKQIDRALPLNMVCGYGATPLI